MMLVVVLVTAVLCGKSSAQDCQPGETQVITDTECEFTSVGLRSCTQFPGRFDAWRVTGSSNALAGCAIRGGEVTVLMFPATCLVQVTSCVPATADLCPAGEILVTTEISCESDAIGTAKCSLTLSDIPGTVADVVVFSTGPSPTCDISSSTLEVTASVPFSCSGSVRSCLSTTPAPSCNAGEVPVLTGVTCIRPAADLTNPCETTLADIPGRFVAVGVTSVVSTEGTFRRFCKIDEMLVATIRGGPSVCSGFAVSCVTAPPPPVCEESEESSDSSKSSDSNSSKESKESGWRNRKNRKIREKIRKSLTRWNKRG